MAKSIFAATSTIVNGAPVFLTFEKGYKAFADKQTEGAWTLTLLTQCRLISITAKGTIKALERGHVSTFRQYAPTAARYWKRKGWLSDNGVTAEGIKTLSARLQGNGSGNNNIGKQLDLVKELLQATAPDNAATAWKGSRLMM